MPKELPSLDDLNKDISSAKELPSLDDLNNEIGNESGVIKGAGTGKSDSIVSTEEDGTLIVPTENVEKAKEIYRTYINKDIPIAKPSSQADATQVKLSNGEFKFTPQDLEILKQKNVDISSLLSDPLKKKEPTSPSLSPFIASPKSQNGQENSAYAPSESDSEVQSTLKEDKPKYEFLNKLVTPKVAKDVNISQQSGLTDTNKDLLFKQNFAKQQAELNKQSAEIDNRFKDYQQDIVISKLAPPNSEEQLNAVKRIQEYQPLIDNDIKASNDIWNKLQENVKKKNELLPNSLSGGAVKSATQSTGDVIEDIGGIIQALTKAYNPMSISSHINPLKGLADDIKNMAEQDMPNVPNTLTGKIVSSAAAVTPLLIETALFPEVKAAENTSMAYKFLTGAVPLAGSLAANEFGKKFSETQSYKESLKAAGAGAAEGTILHGLGVSAGKLGEMVSSKGIISAPTSALLNAAGFMGYGTASRYLEGKETTLDDLAVDAGSSVLLSAGSLGNALFEKAKERTLQSNPEAIKEAINIPESVEELRNKSIDLAEKAKEIKNPDEAYTALQTSQYLYDIADLKSTGEHISENPHPYIEDVKNSDKSTEEKQQQIDTINKVYAENNEISKQTEPIRKEIDAKEKEIANIENNKYLSDIDKKIQIEQKNSEIKELTNKVNESINNLKNDRKEISEPVSQRINRENSESDSRNEKIANELRGRIEKAREDFPIGERDGKESDTRKVDDKAIYDYAKEKGLWINDFNELGERFSGGTEHDIRINKETQKLYKKNNLSNYNTIDRFLEKIKLHNEIFPNTPYKFEGFTGVEKGLRGDPFTEPVYSQDFIKDTQEANPNEISDYMDKLGFDKINEDTFKKGDIQISDLKPRNVLKDKNGDIYVIDAEFKQEQRDNENRKQETSTSTNEGNDIKTKEDSGTKEEISPTTEGGEKELSEPIPLDQLSGIKKALVPDNKIESIDVNKRSIEDVYEQGKKLVDNGEINPKLIIDEINNKARALQANEVASLVYYKAKLDRTFDKLTDKLIKSKEANNIEESTLLNNQLNALSKEMDAYHEMALKTAYEQSLAFRSRQLLVDSEYNLKTQENKYKSINNGVLPEDVAIKFKEYDEKIKEINKKLRELEEQRADEQKNKSREDAEKEAENAVKEEKSKIKKEKIDKIHKERKIIITNIKEKLRKARSGEQGLTAVPIPFAKEFAVIAPDVAKLMRNYAQEGVVHLDDFVNKIHDDLKDIAEGITKNDILNIIAGNYKEPKTRTELQNRLAEVRRKAKLITRLELLENGELPNKQIKEVKPKNEEIEQLKKEIGEHDLTKLGKIKSRYENDIKKYEEKLNNKDFSIPEPKEKPELTKEIRDLEIARTELQNKFDIEQEKARLNNRPLTEKIKDNFLDAVNLPKSLMASADMSAPLRQGAILSARHPIIASKSFVEMFRQAFSEKKADKWLNELRHTKEYSDMRKHDLYISEPTSKLSAKEEQFISNIAKKIPIWGRIVKGSERAYTGYLNKLRVDVFSQFHDQLIKDGFKGKELDSELTAMAKFINNASGRGTLGKFEEAAPLLNSVFFSPRYIASRFNLLNPAKYIEMPKQARIEALKSVGAFIGITSMVIAMAKASGAEVETDPRSSEFGKIKSGNTRYDLWAGFVSIVRLISQLATNEKKNSKGQIVKLGEGYKSDTGLDLTERFIRSKLAPSAGLITDMLAKKDFLGQPITWKDEAIKTILPLWSGDIEDIYKEQGAVKGSATTIANFFGAGVQYYSPDSKGNLPAYKEKYIDEKPLPTNL